MLYSLLYPLADHFTGFNVFRYSPSAPAAPS